MDQFTCSLCHKNYDKERTDEEAMAEAEEEFSAEELEEAAVVCDDCYREIMGLPKE